MKWRSIQHEPDQLAFLLAKHREGDPAAIRMRYLSRADAPFNALNCQRIMTHVVPESASKSAFGKRRRRVPARLLVAIVVAGVLLINALLGRLITFNASPSIPLGFYIRCYQEPGIGELVEIELTPEFSSAHHVPHRLKRDRRVLKPIAAGPGDHIDATAAWLWINGRRIAPIHTTDSNGHALPVWRANRELAQDEYYLLSLRVWNSFDSRSYGAVRRADIIAVRRPLWTWGEDVEGIADVEESTHASVNP